MERLTTVDPVKDERWDSFVRSHPLGSIFHLSAWSQVLVSTFRYIPRYIILENHGVIKGAMPCMKIDSWLTGKRLISLPRTSYCDPLVETSADLEIIMDFVYYLMKKERIDFIEIKTQKNADLLCRSSLKCYEYYRNGILDMKEGLEALWKRFHRSCIRQKIVKAQKDGVRVRSGSSLQDLELFYLLYNVTTRKHEVPPRPYRFIKNIWETFWSRGQVMLLIAEVDNKPGAAGLFLKSRDTLIFELLGINYNVINHSPGHLYGRRYRELTERGCDISILALLLLRISVF